MHEFAVSRGKAAAHASMEQPFSHPSLGLSVFFLSSWACAPQEFFFFRSVTSTFSCFSHVLVPVRASPVPSTRGFYQAANPLQPIHAHCAKDHTNQPTVSGPECAKCGTSQPTSWAGQGPARVAHGSKISSLRVFNTRTSKWVNMGYFTPLQAPRSIFSPLSILKLRQEPLRPLRRGLADRYASAPGQEKNRDARGKSDVGVFQ